MPITHAVASYPVDKIPPVLIEGILTPGGLLHLFGKEGRGKSRLLWQVCCAWARGEPCFGMTPLRPLAIHYIQADMPQWGMGRIIRDARSLGVPTPEKGLWVTEVGPDEDFYIHSPVVRDYLSEFTLANAIDLTVIDTIDDTHVFDALEQGSTLQVIRAWRKATPQSALLYVRHERKPAAHSQDDDDDTSSAASFGSMAWSKKTDTNIRLIAGKQQGKLLFPKCRVGAPRPTLDLARTNFGFFAEDKDSISLKVKAWHAAMIANGAGGSVRSLGAACAKALGIGETTARRYLSQWHTNMKA